MLSLIKYYKNNKKFKNLKKKSNIFRKHEFYTFSRSDLKANLTRDEYGHISIITVLLNV